MVKINSLLKTVILVIFVLAANFSPITSAPTVAAVREKQTRGENISLAAAGEINSSQVPLNFNFQTDYDLVKLIPSGPFMMGSGKTDTKALGDETPQHPVSLPSYWIYRTEVTNQMYSVCVKAGKCSQPGAGIGKEIFDDPANAGLPVVGVNWNEASSYCKYVGARLPTEAEWEKAARGTDARLFPWVNQDPTCDLSNYKGCVTSQPFTNKAGQLTSGNSPYAVADMAGNAKEWVQDWYSENYYSSSNGWDPQGPVSGTRKVIRGGGFNDAPENLRSAARFSAMPSSGFADVGFRCVPEVKTTGSAPFCKNTYPAFCKSPDKTACQTQSGVKTIDEPVVTQVDCSSGDITHIYITTNFTDVSNVQLTVDNNPYYSCQPNTGYAGRVICNGPMPSQGNIVNMQVCQGSPVKTTSQVDEGISPASATTPDNGLSNTNSLFSPTLDRFLVSVNPTPIGLCPEGMKPSSSGICEAVDQDKCPTGWNWRASINRCIPGGSKFCPFSTQYSDAGANPSCLPTIGSCPTGYSILTIDGKPTCYPFKENDLCPTGYRFNTDTNCCVSIPSNNMGCSAGSYFNSTYNRCLPINGDGCGFGKHFDYKDGCIDNFKADGTSVLVSDPKIAANTCPAPLVEDVSNGCKYPSDYQPTQVESQEVPSCLPGDTNQAGTCSVDSGMYKKIDCGSGSVYIASLGICGVVKSDGCPVGYFMDKNAGRCLPESGPGGPCPYGYGYNSETGCCSPLPGNQGSTCPNYPGVANLKAPLPAANITPIYWGKDIASYMRAANFNPLSGKCMPGRGQPCPPGYNFQDNACVLHEWSVTDCFAGTTADEKAKLCRPDKPKTCPENMNYDASDNSCKLNPVVSQALCPFGTNEIDGKCYPDDGKTCPVGTTDGIVIDGKVTCNVVRIPAGNTNLCETTKAYLDANLGICATRNSECCRPGFVMNKIRQECEPQEIKEATPPGVTCPFGTQWSTKDNGCAPPSATLSGIGSAQSCYSIRASIPICNGLCPDPMVWIGNHCVQSYMRPKPVGNCRQWTNLDACSANECNWDLKKLECIPRCSFWTTASRCEENAIRISSKYCDKFDLSEIPSDCIVKECKWDTETSSCQVN